MSGPDSNEVWRKVRDWIAIASADQSAARLCISAETPLLGIAAYHVQQAAEKLLKAALVRSGRDFVKTHDLEGLVRSVAQAIPSVATLVMPMGDWTAWSVAFRYPSENGPEPEPAAAELLAALDVLANVQAAILAFGPLS